MTRTKRSRLRGRRSCGYGARKKHRGKGNRGGKGMAGTGKRAGHLITWILRNKIDYLGKKRGFKIKMAKTKLKEINIDEINKKLNNFLKESIAKKTERGTEVNLKGYKILSRGNTKEKLFISADSFSKKAREKIENAGGAINLI